MIGWALCHGFDGGVEKAHRGINGFAVDADDLFSFEKNGGCGRNVFPGGVGKILTNCVELVHADFVIPVESRADSGNFINFHAGNVHIAGGFGRANQIFIYSVEKTEGVVDGFAGELKDLVSIERGSHLVELLFFLERLERRPACRWKPVLGILVL